MASFDEKTTTFGATVVPSSPRSNPTSNTHLTTDDLLASKEIHSTQISPISPPSMSPSPIPSRIGTPRLSTDAAANAQFPSSNMTTPVTTKTGANVYAHDIESQTQFARGSCDTRDKEECTMWPSMKDQQRKAKEAKRARGCIMCRHMTRKQRLVTQILLGLMLVGLAVGIGVGVSMKVRGGVWAGDHHTEPIPQTP
ncbi:hypothetical protein K402DRAFT_137477 [Aulographum hederae CBS 113979]|uniref:Uncharacterized protein n=1 Tax=Aulographum hederae CBS 113979 TaxID=1176131 RepID=A0A6G1GU89_9PEZI|nr:hypothetical protein K402DRAFT_137477 [Aulographum hederae CBS 113979]